MKGGSLPTMNETLGRNKNDTVSYWLWWTVESVWYVRGGFQDRYNAGEPIARVEFLVIKYEKYELHNSELDYN
jgi:hypothetical protein